ncbi:hypothetical protein OH492_23275 [Vibrio chagasii]|nr:hypothetical protein [Vibrio chagasii]
MTNVKRFTKARTSLAALTTSAKHFRTQPGDVFTSVIDEYIAPQSLEDIWDITGLQDRLKNDFDLDFDIQGWLDEDDKLYEKHYVNAS